MHRVYRLLSLRVVYMATFWLNDLSVLFADGNYSVVVPTDEMSLTERLNAMVRLSIYIGIVISLLSGDYSYMFIPAIMIGLTMFIFKSKAETMQDFFNNYINYTMPTTDNPFGNLDQIHDPKDKPPMIKYYDKPAVKEEVEARFNDTLFRD